MNDTAKLIHFYEKCIENNILEIHDAFSEKKAEKIASFFELDYSKSIYDLFKEAQSAVSNSKEAQSLYEETEKRKALITKAYEEDPKALIRLSRYSSLYGINKPIQMTNDYYNSTLFNANEKYNFSKNKEEKDSIAYDRADFEVHQHYIDMMKNEQKKTLEKYSLKVIGEEDDDTVFNEVNIKNLSYRITPIGSVTIQCTLSLKPDCKIYDHPAYIDGSFIAKIFQNNEFIGAANLVLPIDGLTDQDIVIEGISLCRADFDLDCHIEIMPKNLWKMEA